METFQTIGIILLAVASLAFFVLLLALIRELGIILVRLGPVYAKPTKEGPQIGERVEPLEIADLSGKTHYIRPTKFQQQLLVFVAPGCPVCSELLPGLRTLAADYRDRAIVFAISSSERTPEDFDYAKKLQPFVSYICSPDLHHQFSVDGSPYAILLNADNEVTAKGIANNLQHLESLFSIELYSTHRDSDKEPTPEGFDQPVALQEREE